MIKSELSPNQYPFKLSGQTAAKRGGETNEMELQHWRSSSTKALCRSQGGISPTFGAPSGTREEQSWVHAFICAVSPQAVVSGVFIIPLLQRKKKVENLLENLICFVNSSDVCRKAAGGCRQDDGESDREEQKCAFFPVNTLTPRLHSSPAGLTPSLHHWEMEWDVTDNCAWHSSWLSACVYTQYKQLSFQICKLSYSDHSEMAWQDYFWPKVKRKYTLLDLS